MDSGDGHTRLLGESKSLPVDTWVVFGLRIDGTNKRLTFEADGSATSDSLALPAGSTNDLRVNLGFYPLGSNDGWAAAYDDLAVAFQ
jgi:hypothetical protein